MSRGRIGCRGDFLARTFGDVGERIQRVSGAVVDLRFGWDLASAAGRQECWKTSHAERRW